MQENKRKKGRSFTSVIYPDSAPEDWLERAKSTHLDMLISPLHDKDKNPDGTDKKPHYHILVMWDNPTTLSNAINVMTEIGAANGHVECVESTSGMARYLTHRDNPEKAQYDASDVKSLGSVDYEDLCDKVQDKRRHIADMTEFIINNDITSFAVFSDYCLNNEPRWFHILTDKNTLFIRALIDSQRQDKYDKYRDCYQGE